MVSVLQLVANGIVFSSIIVLGGIGLSIIYSIAGFANFAHGDTMTVGAYAALVAYGSFAGMSGQVLGLPAGFYLALFVGIVIAALVALITELVIYRVIDVDSIGLLITSIGVAFVYRAIIQNTYGRDFQSYGIERSGPTPFFENTLGIAVTERSIVIVVCAVILVTGLHVLLQYTTLGRKMRAMADNASLARVSGIRTRRVKLATWLVGAGLAGAGGVFLGLFNQVAPRMGFSLLLMIFAAVILGGIGSVYGAMLGGVVIGMVDQLTPVFPELGSLLPLVPDGFGIPITPPYSPAIAFLIMVAILLVRPEGIAGGAGK